jgi:WD40 repeat protein
MDISSDSKLIVTCSADKNVKIWGLDFGDCHKSIFAHDESVMQVAFENESHYFWTVGKDKLLKYWDGDKVCRLIHDMMDVMPELSCTRNFSSKIFKSWRDTIVKCGPSQSAIRVILW